MFCSYCNIIMIDFIECKKPFCLGFCKDCVYHDVCQKCKFNLVKRVKA